MAAQQTELAALIRRIKDKEGELTTKDKQLEGIVGQLRQQQQVLSQLRASHQEQLTAAHKQLADERVKKVEGEADRVKKLADAEIALRQLMGERDRVAAERKKIEAERATLASRAQNTRPQPSTRTVVAEQKITRGRSVEMAGTKQAERVQNNSMTPKQRRELVSKLKKALDDYANPAAKPSSLEPHLAQLVALTGQEAAVDMVTVYRHARDLLKDLDRNIAFLDRKNESLQRAADQVSARQAPSSGQTNRRRGTPTKKEHVSEQHQRLLELYERKTQIKEAQRQRLVSLRDHVCQQGFGKLTSDPQTQYLVGRFSNESDPVQRMAILGASEAAKARHAIPALISKLSLRDEELKGTIQEVLTGLAGVDKGAKKADWQKWWNENKDL